MAEPQVQSVSDWKAPSINGWRAEVGMLAPLPGMYREWKTMVPQVSYFTEPQSWFAFSSWLP